MTISSMKLFRVVYELYDSDAVYLDHHQPQDWHVIDREICLSSEDGRSVYVSWSNRPVHHAIDVLESPAFRRPVPVVRDMTRSLIWSHLIGQEITFRFLDQGHQVLEIAAPEAAVYCSSQENGNWGADVVRVSIDRPSQPPSIDRIP